MPQKRLTIHRRNGPYVPPFADFTARNSFNEAFSYQWSSRHITFATLFSCFPWIVAWLWKLLLLFLSNMSVNQSFPEGLGMGGRVLCATDTHKGTGQCCFFYLFDDMLLELWQNQRHKVNRWHAGYSIEAGRLFVSAGHNCTTHEQDGAAFGFILSSVSSLNLLWFCWLQKGLAVFLDVLSWVFCKGSHPEMF